MNPALSFVLRPVDATDLPVFYAQARDREALRMAPPARALVGWPTFQRHWAHLASNHDVVCRTVVEGEQPAGYVALFPQLGVPSIAYWYGQAFWGRGLARSALKRFLADVEQRPLTARAAVTNPASQRVLLANGFQAVGTDHYFSPRLGREVEETVYRLNTHD